MILDYKYRPKPIKTSEYNQRKKVIAEKASMMLEAAKRMQEEQREVARGRSSRRRQRDLRNRQDRFRKDVLVLEHHYLRMNESYKMQGGNALLQIVLLIVGVVGGIVSLMWIIHICIYDLPVQVGVYPPDAFLNNFFKSVSVVPFIGIALYALWSFWLLGCVLKVGPRVVLGGVNRV
ncbi:hypothetical protein HDU93_001052 [Gonapodya sp. JEL0774]|nr:hypothetical protein HDU93_001052 [Gonapodya sp. JEL0774]